MNYAELLETTQGVQCLKETSLIMMILTQKMKSKMSLELPKTYSKEQWERGGSRPEHKKFIGMPVTSWSQVESWTATKGFNTGLAGNKEYMIRYFLGERFPDMGWGQFSNEVEDCVTLGECGSFGEKELEVMKGVKPLGVFQDEIVVDFGEFCLIGYIDDRSDEEDGVVEIVRDYKTKSKSSKADLHDPKKLQLELYILGLQQRGWEVKNAEYMIIEKRLFALNRDEYRDYLKQKNKK